MPDAGAAGSGHDGAMLTVMWEARAAAGRIDDLVAYVLAHGAERAEVYRSRDDRVVLIDPTGRGLDDVPGELVARPPHVWPFERVTRPAACT